MPSVSAKQHRFFEAVAHSPRFAKQAGVPQSVGQDFARADDRAGITRTHNGKPVGSPQSREEHMRRRAKHVGQKQAAREFGVSQPTVSRRTRRQGYTSEGLAR